MAYKLLRNGLLLAKQEVSYGVDPVPAAADFVLANIPEWQMATNKKERDLMRSTLTSCGQMIGSARQTLQFALEMFGAGATPNGTNYPIWIKVLEACGVAVAFSVDTYNVRFSDDVFKSVTLYYWIEGIRHALVGARGTAVMTFEPESYPLCQFNMTGLYAAPSDVVQQGGISWPACNVLPQKAQSIGLEFNGVWTPTGVSKITLDLGTSIDTREDMQAAAAASISEIMINGRAPKAVFEVDMPATLAAFDAPAKHRAGDTVTAEWSFGSGAGNLFTFSLSGQLEEPRVVNRNGIAGWELGMNLTGAPELEMTMSLSDSA